MELDSLLTKVVTERISKSGGDLELAINTAKALLLAGVSEAKVYGYCKTGMVPGSAATQEYYDAVREFLTVVKGH